MPRQGVTPSRRQIGAPAFAFISFTSPASKSFATALCASGLLLQTGVAGDTRVDGAAKGDLALVPLHRWTSWTDRACRGNSLGSERMSLRGSTGPPSQLCRRADSLGDVETDRFVARGGE